MSSQEPSSEQPAEEPPPEQQPAEERAINPDPREQPRSDYATPQMPPPGYPPQAFPPPQQGYPRGYPPPQQGYPQQGYPPQQGYYSGQAVAPRRRRGPWLGCLIAFIIVQAKKYASFGGNLNNVQINYSQNGSTVNVAANSSGTFNFFNSTSVDFTITVPPTTDVQKNTNAGSITVNGISGKMSLVSNAGTIGATQASLTGSSMFKTNAGSINFNGVIGSTGTYDFETNAGSIDMTLTGTTNFQVNATTDVGSINSNFPLTVNHSGAGATANGNVGSSPQATLTLKTNAGSITLNKG